MSFCFSQQHAGCKRLTFFRLSQDKRNPLVKLNFLIHLWFSAFFTLQNFPIFERAAQSQTNDIVSVFEVLDGCCCINRNLETRIIWSVFPLRMDMCGIEVLFINTFFLFLYFFALDSAEKDLIHRKF